MSIKLMSAIFETEFPDALYNSSGEKTKASTAKLVLLAIADHANDEGESAYPGLRRIERKTGLSRQGIIDTIEALKFNGLLTVSAEPSRIGTNNYTVVTSAYPSMGGTPSVLVQWAVEGGQPTLPPPVNPLDHNHHLTIIKPSLTDDVQKSISQANVKVDAIIKGALDSGKGWPGREKMPEGMRDLMDAFVEVSGIKPTRGQINDWFATASDWIEIGAQKADIRAAFEKSRPNIDQKRTGFTVGRPGSLTTTIQAVVGERRTIKTTGTLMEFMDRYALEHPNE